MERQGYDFQVENTMKEEWLIMSFMAMDYLNLQMEKSMKETMKITKLKEKGRSFVHKNISKLEISKMV